MGKIRKSMNGQKGFTLVELIVVIAILGILATLVVPRFTNTLETQKEKTDLANIRTVQSAYDLYLVDNMEDAVPATTSEDNLKKYLVSDGEYLDNMPKMQSKELMNDGDQYGWGASSTLITYGGKTYTELVDFIENETADNKPE